MLLQNNIFENILSKNLKNNDVKKCKNIIVFQKYYFVKKNVFKEFKTF